VDDRQAGAEEGAKDRPCALVSATVKEAGRRILGVVPITHSSPIDAAAAIEISAVTNVSDSGLIRTVLDRLRRSESVRLAGQDPRSRRALAGECLVRAAAAEAHRRRPRQIARTRPDAPLKQYELRRDRTEQGRGGMVMSRPRMRPYPAAPGGQCGRGRGRDRCDRARVA
jgi:hypothetical protein